MRAAQIEVGRVKNIIVVAALDALPNLVDATGAHIGDLWDGVSFTTPPRDPAVVAEEQRIAEVDTQLEATALPDGTTLRQLQTMSWADASAKYDATIDTTAKALALLKRLTLLIIRRVL